MHYSRKDREPVTEWEGFNPDKCAAWSKTNPELQCRNYPMRGQKVCRFHGGATKRSRTAAQDRMHEAAAIVETRKFAQPVNVGPSDALLDEVRWTAGHVKYLRNKVEELAEAGGADIVFGTTKELTTSNGVEITESSGIHVWYQLYLRERDHLVRVATAAVNAGVEQRRVDLAERQGNLVALVLERILAGVLDALLNAGIEVQARMWDGIIQDIVPREVRALTLEQEPAV